MVRTTFDGSYFETKCVSPGQWSNPPPTCWGEDSQSTNNHIQSSLNLFLHGFTENESAIFKFTFVLFISVPLGQCSIPNIEFADINGYPVGTWINHGKTFEYTCKNGLVPVHSSIVTCYNGTFNPGPPKCVPGIFVLFFL